ncbi:MAG: alpha/beta fold hydrolase, partial [Novosphingobium sp.]
QGDDAAKRRATWVLGRLVVRAGAFLLLRTPDTDPAAMKAKYGGTPSQFVDLGGGLTVHLRDEGPRGAPVLMLLHGSNADLHTWDAWTKALSGQFRVIRFDQIGHGLTGPNPVGGHSLDDMVAVTEKVRARLGIERMALAGNSMGGGIAAKYAMVHPQHLSALILVDAGGAPQPAGRKGRGNIGFTLAATPGVNLLMRSITPRSIVERSLRQSVSNEAIVTEAAVDRYWELLRYPGNRAATAERFAIPRRAFTTQDLAAIKTPTLILWGEEDKLISVAGARWYNAGIAGSKLKIFPRIGHLPHEEAAEATAAEVRTFLSPQR